jgi:molybdopterin converting factor small subunit
MKVYLKIFSVLANKLSDVLKSQYPEGLKAGTVVELDLPSTSSISNLMDNLNLRSNNKYLIFVNGKSQKHDYLLSEGDQIGIFPPIGGG